MIEPAQRESARYHHRVRFIDAEWQDCGDNQSERGSDQDDRAYSATIADCRRCRGKEYGLARVHALYLTRCVRCGNALAPSHVHYLR